jgi:hypothetical protein
MILKNFQLEHNLPLKFLFQKLNAFLTPSGNPFFVREIAPQITWLRLPSSPLLPQENPSFSREIIA